MPTRMVELTAFEGASPVRSLAATGILIVDDDAVIRESVSFLLEDEGYCVHAAAGGRQALALLERIPRPGLALVDLRMPEMDGVELIEVLRSDARWVDLPLVVFSAASIVAAPEGVPLLRKPIGITQLLETVRRHAVAG
jgi:CheY-like chemotaxis protein